MEAEEDRYSDNYALYRTFEEMDEEVLLVHQLCDQSLGYVSFFEEAQLLINQHQCPGRPQRNGPK